MNKTTTCKCLHSIVEHRLLGTAQCRGCTCTNFRSLDGASEANVARWRTRVDHPLQMLWIACLAVTGWIIYIHLTDATGWRLLFSMIGYWFLLKGALRLMRWANRKIDKLASSREYDRLQLERIEKEGQ